MLCHVTSNLQVIYIIILDSKLSIFLEFFFLKKIYRKIKIKIKILRLIISMIN